MKGLWGLALSGVDVDVDGVVFEAENRDGWV